MNISPALSDVEKIAATGKYDVLPVSCEILSDFITPIEAIRILKNVSKHSYMLESAQADETWGRYTFLGFDPKMEITCIGGTMNGILEAGKMKYVTGDPSDYIRGVLSAYRSPRFEDLPPFTGDTFRSITSATASQVQSRRRKTVSTSGMWTSCCLTR